MLRIRRLAALICTLALVVACGKSPPPGSGDALPLAFAPADTPYAYANLEPLPADVLAAQSKHMHVFWPMMFDQYDTLLNNGALGEKPRKIISAVLDELRPRDSLDKLRELGFKPDGHLALYGIGLIPVLRIELSDPAAFKAMLARIEAKVGEKIPTGKTGAQEYWQFGDAQMSVVVAVQNSHLVLTMWAPEVSDQVKQTLLGITRPAKTLADAGTLQAIAKQYGYAPYGAGYFDFVALVQRLSSAPTGSDLEMAKAMKLPTDGAITDPVCKTEILAIAQTFPRVLVGSEAIAPDHVKIGMQFEMAASLAQQIAAAVTPAPGTGAAPQGLMDLSLSVPILKLKDFWLKQVDAVAAKPFACPQLAGINESFRSSKETVDTTIPPPLSDLTGIRMTLTRIIPGATPSAQPDVAGKFFIGTSNPLVAIGMAQLALPQLKDLKIAADGKPVALPAGLAPNAPPMTVAVSDKAIAMATGKGEDANIGEFLAAAPAATPVFMRVYFSGAVYGLMARYGDVLKLHQGKSAIDQTKLLSMYEKMLRTIEFTFEANANGVAMHETVDTNPGD